MWIWSGPKLVCAKSQTDSPRGPHGPKKLQVPFLFIASSEHPTVLYIQKSLQQLHICLNSSPLYFWKALCHWAIISNNFTTTMHSAMWEIDSEGSDQKSWWSFDFQQSQAVSCRDWIEWLQSISKSTDAGKTRPISKTYVRSVREW